LIQKRDDVIWRVVESLYEAESYAFSMRFLSKIHFGYSNKSGCYEKSYVSCSYIQVNSSVMLYKIIKFGFSLPSATQSWLHKHARTEPIRKIHSWASNSNSVISSGSSDDGRHVHFHFRNRVWLQIQQVSESEICLHSWTEYFRWIFHDHFFMGKKLC